MWMHGLDFILLSLFLEQIRRWHSSLDRLVEEVVAVHLRDFVHVCDWYAYNCVGSFVYYLLFYWRKFVLLIEFWHDWSLSNYCLFWLLLFCLGRLLCI